MTIAEYYAAWLPSLTLRDLNVRTVENYERLFRLHLLPMLGDARLASLKRRDVHDVLLELHRSGRGRRTVQASYSALSALCANAVTRQLLDQNPVSGALLGVFRRRPAGWAVGKAMTRDQLAQFLASVQDLFPQVYDYFVTLAATGMRPAEALALRPGHLDVENRRIHVREQWLRRAVDLPKGRKIRWVNDVPWECLSRLVTRAEDGRAWLFASPYRDRTPYDISYLEKCMRHACEGAGLTQRFTPHCLRHTYATMLLELTGDCTYVSRQLGHSSVAITVDLYGAGAQPRHPEAADRLDALLHRRGPLRAGPEPATRDGGRSVVGLARPA